MVGIFRRLFRKDTVPSEDPMVPVPVPPLVEVLSWIEQEKGRPLTKEEVLKARDECVCMMMPVSARSALEKSRGGRDLDLENCWEEWCSLSANSEGDTGQRH